MLVLRVRIYRVRMGSGGRDWSQHATRGRPGDPGQGGALPTSCSAGILYLQLASTSMLAITDLGGTSIAASPVSQPGYEVLQHALDLSRLPRLGSLRWAGPNRPFTSALAAVGGAIMIFWRQ
jgi:hypothetical protein